MDVSLRPDVAGYTTNDQYTVTATVYTANAGTTNVTMTITAGTYMGVGLLPGTYGCALCHSGGQIAPNKVVPWEATAHATQFSRGIDGILEAAITAPVASSATPSATTPTRWRSTADSTTWPRHWDGISRRF